MTRTRKAASRKSASRKMEGGKRKTARKGRKLSPALAAWNKRVMEVYREMKKRNPATKLRDAMKEAKKRKDRE